jgi:hypothetical protein
MINYHFVDAFVFRSFCCRQITLLLFVLSSRTAAYTIYIYTIPNVASMVATRLHFARFPKSKGVRIVNDSQNNDDLPEVAIATARLQL